MSANLMNPYRPFFFIGTLASIVGVGVWIVHAFIPTSPYPGIFHAHVMMGLFLMSFALGFLMTALPKMTQTFPTQRFEFVTASLLLGLLATVGLGDDSGKEFYVGILLNALFLLFFAGRRIVKRKNNLPEIFPLVLWGLSSAVAGAVLSLFNIQPLGEKLFYLNFMLCLVLGVGMRLVPTLLRLNAKAQKINSFYFFLAGALLTLSTVAEQLWTESWGAYLRAVVVSAVAIFGWRFWERSESNTGLAWGVRMAALFTVLGSWSMAIFPAYRLEAVHVIYVTGFSLMTLMVASRVILAHGNFGIENEAGNLFIKIPIACLFLAGLTRVSAIFVPGNYIQHLGFAAFWFILGVGIWAKYFLPRVFSNYGQFEK